MNENSRSTQELKTLINAIDAGIYITALDESPLLFNRTMETTIGYTLEEARNIEGLLDLLLPKDLSPTQALASSNSKQTRPSAPHKRVLVHTNAGVSKSLTVTSSQLCIQEQQFLIHTYHEVKQQAEDDFARLLKSVVINANDAILITEAEPFAEPGPKIVYANEAFTRMTGYSTDEILGQTPRILQGEKTSPIQKANIRQQLEEWKPVREELINYKKDGTEFWVELNIVPVANATGWFTHWISIQRDITSQKHLEKALRDSQQQCKLAVTSGKMGLWDWDLTTQEIQLDPSLQEMMGLAKPGIHNIVQGWSPLVHPDDLDRVLAAVSRHLNHETSTFDVEYRMRHHSGEHLWVYTRGQAFWTEAGEPYRMIGLNANITDRKQTETALVKSERRFRQIFTEAPIGIIQFQASGQLIQVNPSFCHMLGYSETELLALNLKDITHPEDIQTEQTYLQQILNTDTSIYQLEKRYISKNRDTVWTQVNRGKIQLSDDQNPILIEMVQDVTERRQIEQMKDDFLSIVTHELRTPLTSLKGALNLLSTEKLGELSEQGQRMLSFANADADLLVRLITDMLDLDRLKSGTLAISPQMCQTKDLLDQVIQIVQPLATTANIELTIESVNVPIWVDRDYIVQTLTNLISNAIKFSRSGSRIWLMSSQQNQSLLFRVIDQGRGIPPEKLETIFERFQQVDASDSRQRGGIGLGLAICKSIVQQHGGQIWAESTPNKGSTFSFTLPLPSE